MATKIYSRFELARNQLEAAFYLYASGRDRYSVITLAGAADVILSQLLVRTGVENFSDRMAKKQKDEGVFDATRITAGSAINDILYINHMKHLDPGDSADIEIDAEDCALGTLLKAMVNYKRLTSTSDPLFLGFVIWSLKNVDREKYPAVSALEHIVSKDALANLYP